MSFLEFYGCLGIFVIPYPIPLRAPVLLILRVQQVISRTVIGGLELRQMEHHLADVVGAEGLVERLPDVTHDAGIALHVLVGTPYHEGHVILEVHALGLLLGVELHPAEGVAVVVHLLAMVGKIEDYRVLVAVEVDDLPQHMVIVERGIVILRYQLALAVVQIGFVQLDVLGSEPLEGLLVGIAGTRHHVLAYQVEQHQLAALPVP